MFIIDFHVYNLNYGFEWWITGYVIELLCNCSVESCLDRSSTWVT